MKCPNANRKRTRGNGLAGCDGEIELRMSIPISLKAVRWPKSWNGAEVALDARRMKHGLRIAGEMLREFASNGDLVCDKCGWSLNRACKPSKGKK